MREITVSEDGSLKHALRRVFPALTAAALNRALRQRDIRRGGIRLDAGAQVRAGDVLQVYISDELLLGEVPEIVYQDEHTLVVNKRPGVSVTSDASGALTLTQAIERHIGRAAYPCHRLDHNTGGLMLYALDEARLTQLEGMIKRHEVRRVYRCLVKGAPQPPAGTLRAYLLKDARKAVVQVQDNPADGALPIITHYKTMHAYNGLSELEVRLETGRTHQIRAHMAHIGHPVIGDDKYGDRALNKALGFKRQALWSVELAFEDRCFTVPPGYGTLDYRETPGAPPPSPCQKGRVPLEPL